MVKVAQLGNDSLALELKRGDRVEVVEEGLLPRGDVGKRATVVEVGPSKGLSEGRLFVDMDGMPGPVDLADVDQVKLIAVRGMSEEEKGDWKDKPKEERWKVIEGIVSEAREFRGRESSDRPLAERLKKLREMGCTIDVQSHNGYEYLRASKSIAGTTRTKILGRPDGGWRKACELAGVELQSG